MDKNSVVSEKDNFQNLELETRNNQTQNILENNRAEILKFGEAETQNKAEKIIRLKNTNETKLSDYINEDQNNNVGMQNNTNNFIYDDQIDKESLKELVMNKRNNKKSLSIKQNGNQHNDNDVDIFEWGNQLETDNSKHMEEGLSNNVDDFNQISTIIGHEIEKKLYLSEGKELLIIPEVVTESSFSENNLDICEGKELLITPEVINESFLTKNNLRVFEEGNPLFLAEDTKECSFIENTSLPHINMSLESIDKNTINTDLTYEIPTIDQKDVFKNIQYENSKISVESINQTPDLTSSLLDIGISKTFKSVDTKTDLSSLNKLTYKKENISTMEMTDSKKLKNNGNESPFLTKEITEDESQPLNSFTPIFPDNTTSLQNLRFEQVKNDSDFETYTQFLCNDFFLDKNTVDLIKNYLKKLHRNLKEKPSEFTLKLIVCSLTSRPFNPPLVICEDLNRSIKDAYGKYRVYTNEYCYEMLWFLCLHLISTETLSEQDIYDSFKEYLLKYIKKNKENIHIAYKTAKSQKSKVSYTQNTDGNANLIEEYSIQEKNLQENIGSEINSDNLDILMDNKNLYPVSKLKKPTFIDMNQETLEESRNYDDTNKIFLENNNSRLETNQIAVTSINNVSICKSDKSTVPDTSKLESSGYNDLLTNLHGRININFNPDNDPMSFLYRNILVDAIADQFELPYKLKRDFPNIYSKENPNGIGSLPCIDVQIKEKSLETLHNKYLNTKYISNNYMKINEIVYYIQKDEAVIKQRDNIIDLVMGIQKSSESYLKNIFIDDEINKLNLIDLLECYRRAGSPVNECLITENDFYNEELDQNSTQINNKQLSLQNNASHLDLKDVLVINQDAFVSDITEKNKESLQNNASHLNLKDVQVINQDVIISDITEKNKEMSSGFDSELYSMQNKNTLKENGVLFFDPSSLSNNFHLDECYCIKKSCYNSFDEKFGYLVQKKYYKEILAKSEIDLKIHASKITENLLERIISQNKNYSEEIYQKPRTNYGNNALIDFNKDNSKTERTIGSLMTLKSIEDTSKKQKESLLQKNEDNIDQKLADNISLEKSKTEFIRRIDEENFDWVVQRIEIISRSTPLEDIYSIKSIRPSIIEEICCGLSEALAHSSVNKILVENSLLDISLINVGLLNDLNDGSCLEYKKEALVRSDKYKDLSKNKISSSDSNPFNFAEDISPNNKASSSHTFYDLYFEDSGTKFTSVPGLSDEIENDDLFLETKFNEGNEKSEQSISSVDFEKSLDLRSSYQDPTNFRNFCKICYDEDIKPKDNKTSIDKLFNFKSISKLQIAFLQIYAGFLERIQLFEHEKNDITSLFSSFLNDILDFSFVKAGIKINRDNFLTNGVLVYIILNKNISFILNQHEKTTNQTHSFENTNSINNPHSEEECGITQKSIIPGDIKKDLNTFNQKFSEKEYRSIEKNQTFYDGENNSNPLNKQCSEKEYRSIEKNQTFYDFESNNYPFNNQGTEEIYRLEKINPISGSREKDLKTYKNLQVKLKKDATNYEKLKNQDLNQKTILDESFVDINEIFFQLFDFQNPSKPVLKDNNNKSDLDVEEDTEWFIDDYDLATSEINEFKERREFPEKQNIEAKVHSTSINTEIIVKKEFINITTQIYYIFLLNLFSKNMCMSCLLEKYFKNTYNHNYLETSNGLIAVVDYLQNLLKVRSMEDHRSFIYDPEILKKIKNCTCYETTEFFIET